MHVGIWQWVRDGPCGIIVDLRSRCVVLRLRECSDAVALWSAAEDAAVVVGTTACIVGFGHAGGVTRFTNHSAARCIVLTNLLVGCATGASALEFVCAAARLARLYAGCRTIRGFFTDLSDLVTAGRIMFGQAQFADHDTTAAVGNILALFIRVAVL